MHFDVQDRLVLDLCGDPIILTCPTQHAEEKPQPRTPGARVEFKSPKGVTRPADSTRMAQELGVEVNISLLFGAYCRWLRPCCGVLNPPEMHQCGILVSAAGQVLAHMRALDILQVEEADCEVEDQKALTFRGKGAGPPGTKVTSRVHMCTTAAVPPFQYVNASTADIIQSP